MLVYLNKDRFGLKYRTEVNSAWNYLPDSAQSLQGAKDYFTQGGRYNDPSIIFTDDRGTLITHYAVKGNGAIINYDGKDTITLPEEYFLPYEEQIALLQQTSTTETDQEANRIQDTWQRLQFYRKKADESELAGLNNLLKERTTPEKITEYLKVHAKKFYNNTAAVEFQT